MDFTTLTEHFVSVVLVACLVVGYIIKHATFLNKIPNTDIPCILAVIGAAIRTESLVDSLSNPSRVWSRHGLSVHRSASGIYTVY